MKACATIFRTAAVLAATITALHLAGCRYAAPSPTPDAGRARAFQDENYVWDSWEYGTNRVDSAAGALR